MGTLLIIRRLKSVDTLESVVVSHRKCSPGAKSKRVVMRYWIFVVIVLCLCISAVLLVRYKSPLGSTSVDSVAAVRVITVKQQSRRAREIQEAIRVVLLELWNPCHVKGVPDLRDEYDSYIGGVYALLSSGRQAVEIARYLASVEKQAMGFSTDPSDSLDVAERLGAIDVRLNPDATT